jgi:hypothetical protein
MPVNSELHIILPGVCGPLAEVQSLKNSRLIKSWIKNLSKSCSYPSSTNVYDVVASIFKLSIEGDFPSAALVLLANDMFDVSLNYMHADPVHLRADLDHAVLTSSADLFIKEKESEVLCDALNQHFNQDGLTFFRLNKNQWFVSSKNKIQLDTTPLVDATGRNINFLLPQGKDSAYWKQVLTEAQMLMHSHEVNFNRENSGQQSINSLWFHGAGLLPELSNSKITSICSDHDMFKGLARHVKCDYLKVPDSVNEYAAYLLSCKNNTVNLLHLSDLEHLINYTDVNIWLDKLTKVLNHWIYPLLKVANKNNINVILYPCNEKQYHFSKHDGLKFWSQGTLDEHIKSY